MTVFNLGTNVLTESTDFTSFQPYFPTPGFTYFLRATLNESSYFDFRGYVLVVTEFRIPPVTDYRWEFSSKIYPSPFPVNFSVFVPSMLPTNVIYRPLARVIKPFRGETPDNITLTLEFDDTAMEAL